MSVTSDLELLRARFRAAFDTVTTKTVFDNAPDSVIDKTAPWVRFGINPSQVDRTTFGTSGTRSHEGMVWLQIFIPKGDGAKTAYEIAEEFALVFDGWRSADADLACGDHTLRQVPNDEAFQVNVMVPYVGRYTL